MNEHIVQLQENAADVLKQFSSLFALNYGCFLLEDIVADISKENGDGPKEAVWKLTKRIGGSKRKDDLYKGELWMRKGFGAGDFGNWKKVYVVEAESHNIEIYDKEKSFLDGKKPIKTIQPAGYELLTDVREHYKKAAKDLFKDVEEEVEILTSDIEPYSWALTHSNRQNYLFLARSNKMKKISPIFMLCGCAGGSDPGDVEEETDEERGRRNAAIDFMTTCIDCAQPRETKTAEGRAFQMTMRKLPEKLEQLPVDWKDDGTEAEMLLDLLMTVCFEPQRDAILQEIKGPAPIRIITWYKIFISVRKSLRVLVENAWKLARDGLPTLRENLEPIIRKGIKKIVEFKMTIERKVKDAVLSKVGSLLAKNVTPLLKPLMELYEYPLRGSLSNGKEYLKQKMGTKCLPVNFKERQSYLERLLDDGESREFLYKGLYDMNSALANFEDICEIGGEVFKGVRPFLLRSQVKSLVDEILDAAIYTFIIRLNKPLHSLDLCSGFNDCVEGVSNHAFEQDTEDIVAKEITAAESAEILFKLFEDFDHDMQIVRSQFIKEAVHSLLLEPFHKLVDPTIKPVVEEINEAIPDEFEKFFSLEKVLDDVVNFCVWQPVEQMVDAAYPLPVE